MTMDQAKEDAGTIAALMIRFKEYRIPRAKQMLEKVNDGELLSHEDISFLRRVFNDSRNTRSLVERNPEYNSLIVKAIDLYTEVITRGLENEKERSGR
jgi:hypothetical protein